MKRRHLIASLGAAALASAVERAWPAQAPVPSRRLDPLRIGVDHALVLGGLAAHVKQGFNARTGLSIHLVPGASASLIESLDAGELDATLTLAPELSGRLEKQGLAHDGHDVGMLDFMLVGPVDKKGHDPVGAAGGKFTTVALTQIAKAGAPFLGYTGGTGANLLEQSLWQAARISPEAPWYRAIAKADDDALAQAAAGQFYVLTDRARWSKGGATGLGVIVQGDELLRVPVHVMRPFRFQHPMAKLFVSWLAGPLGQRSVGR